tara:strand:+ start:3464 stop:3937 length:474 start_codon:yes stop_codon:yes gene_type:complete
MPGMPIRKRRRAREARMWSDPEFWDTIFNGYSEFGSLPKMARELEVPYKSLYHQITSNDELNNRYKEAKRAYAELSASEIVGIAEKLEKGLIDPASAKSIINAKQWVCEKYAPIEYGQRQSIDMQVTDGTQLHLEALRNQMKMNTPKDITPEQKKID